MYLSITNLPKKITRKEVRSAAEFFANMLMSTRLLDSIGIILKFTKVKGAKASVYQDPDIPRNFCIEMDTGLTRKLIIKSLAHEMVHVWQYASGKMKDYVREPGKVRFGEKIYDYSIESEEYWFLPWEIEAYGMEVGLYQHYLMMLKSLKKENKK
jgi:hypothetical protein